MTNEDVLRFLNEAKEHFGEGARFFVKENVSDELVYVDEEDNCIFRTDEMLSELFLKAGF